MLEALGLPAADGLRQTLYEAFTDRSNYGLFDDVQSAMARMSKISRIYEAGTGAIPTLHEARFRAFKQLQSLAREIR